MLRVIDNALCFQGAGDYPDPVYVVRVTPACFKRRKIKSRLYQYKFEEYSSDPRNIVEELKACWMTPSELYPDIDRRLPALRLRWVSARILMHRELLVDSSRRGRARLHSRQFGGEQTLAGEPSASVPNHCDDERALAPAYIAFEMENLLPGTEHELSIRDRYGQGRAQ